MIYVFVVQVIDTSDTSNTANSIDTSKTSASVTRLSSYWVCTGYCRDPESLQCVLENLTFRENALSFSPHPVDDPNGHEEYMLGQMRGKW